MAKKQTIDKTKDFFTKNIWSQNPKGDFLSTYNIYIDKLRTARDQVTNQPISPDDFNKRYKAYLLYKKQEEKKFVKGGSNPILLIHEWLIQDEFQNNYKDIKESIPERDVYLFGENFL